MSIEIRDLSPKDYDIAQKYAIEGMNLKSYVDYGYELFLYSKYFFYLKLLKSTQILAAYEGDKLLGVLMAQMKNEPIKFKSFFYSAYVKR